MRNNDPRPTRARLRRKPLLMAGALAIVAVVGMVGGVSDLSHPAEKIGTLFNAAAGSTTGDTTTTPAKPDPTVTREPLPESGLVQARDQQTGKPSTTASDPAASEPGRELPPKYARLLAELDRIEPLDETGTAISEEPTNRTATSGPNVTAGPQQGTTAGPQHSTSFKSSTTEVFDIDLFKQNIRAALDGETVGYTYSIGKSGNLYSQDGVGLARTEADGEVPQSATKDMTVASVSKTITTVAALRVFEEKGISVDDPIGPWLPGTWEPGAGVAEITFRELMTHTSGLRQNYETATGESGKVTSAYDNIKIAVEQDLGSQTGSYANMNFGIFRIMLPAMLLDTEVPDYDFSVGLADEWDELTSTIFNDHMHALFASIGVDGSCAPSDPAATVLYRLPYDGEPGWETPSYILGCGGYGYYLSANDLTAFLSYLRYTDELLSPESRTLMRDGLLGLQTKSGTHGTAYGHGGYWTSGSGAMTSCVLSFPIHVDASLLINSEGGDYGSDSTCSVLANAFDDAWVPSS